MKRNGITKIAKAKRIPTIILFRPLRLAPLLIKWRKQHPSTSWSWLMRRALTNHLRDYAGKRYSQILEEQ